MGGDVAKLLVGVAQRDAEVEPARIGAEPLGRVWIDPLQRALAVFSDRAECLDNSERRRLPSGRRQTLRVEIADEPVIGACWIGTEDCPDGERRDATIRVILVEAGAQSSERFRRANRQ